MVLPFFALTIPVFLAMGALIVDGGNYYARSAQTQHLSRTISNSILSQLSLNLTDIATQNYQAQCFIDEPPPKCSSSSNWKDFISQSQIDQYILNTTTQNQLISQAKEFAIKYDPAKSLSQANITIEYPFSFEPNARTLRSKVIIETQPQLWINHFKLNQPIQSVGIAQLQL